MEERKINPATVINDVFIHPVERVFIFRTQELMDLYRNEIEGQISDGMWENSRGTEWVWTGQTAYLLGDKTELRVVSKYWGAQKKTYYLSKELCDIVGERAMIEAGFPDMDSMKKGWKEIADAIKNAVSYTAEEYERFITAPEARKKIARDKAVETVHNYLKEHSKYLTVVENTYWKGEYKIEPRDREILSYRWSFKTSVNYTAPEKSKLYIEYSSSCDQMNKATLRVDLDKVDSAIEALQYHIDAINKIGK